MPPAKPKTKPGIKTTEFWITAFVAAAPTLMASVEKMAPEVAASIAAVAGIVYTLSRALVKKGE